MPMLDLHGPLAFTPPAGSEIAVAARGALLEPDRVALRLQLPPATWARVRDHALFGAHPAVLPADRAAFDPDRPVTVVIDLHPTLVSEVLAAPDPAGRLGRGLGTSGDPLLNSEHWHLRTAAQAVDLPADSPAAAAEVESGFTTAHVSAGGAGSARVPLADAVTAAMQAHDLAPIPFSETAVRARVEDASGAWTLVVMMEPAVGLCTVYSAFPRPLAAELRPQATDILTQINAELTIGTVELDEDGQLRVRTGVDLGGAETDPALVERTIGHNLALMREAWETFSALAPG